MITVVINLAKCVNMSTCNIKFTKYFLFYVLTSTIIVSITNLQLFIKTIHPKNLAM